MSPASGVLIAGRRDLKRAVATALLESYSHRTARSSIANFAGALFVAWVVATPATLQVIAFWIAAIALSLGVSYSVNYFYRKARATLGQPAPRFIWAHVASAALNGLVWGCGSVFLYTGRLEYDLLLSIALSCVAAVAVTTRSTIRYAALFMSTFVLFAPVVHLINAGGTFYPLLGFGGVVFWAAMMWFAISTNDLYFSSIDVNQRNIDLAQQLSAKNQELELSITRIEETARVDYLTGCYNRSHLMSRFAEERDRTERFGNPLSFVLIDVDHFKQVNDEHGHLFGDKVLKAVAQQIQHCVRRMDVVARFGGEEFACLLPEANHDEAVVIAERIRRTIADAPVFVGNTQARVTVSVGVGHWCPNSSIEKLINKADKALYQAKRNGRDRVIVATSDCAA